LSRLVPTLLLLACATGCDVTPEKIARWKETERGPRKLRDAAQDPSVAPALRGQALAALVELGMTGDVIGDLQKRPDAERQETAHAAVAPLAALAGSDAAPTTRVQREAKDALFLLRQIAAPADRTAIDDKLIAWVTADLPGRMSAGGQGTEKILAAIGPRAGPSLLGLLQPGSASLLPVASLLAHVADAPTRTRAADMLVQQARRVSGGGKELNDTYLQSLAVLGDGHATAYLLELAEHAGAHTRERALFALAQAHAPGEAATLAAAATRIAADKKAAGEVREAGFQLAEKVGAPSVPGLLKLLDDADETVRWRAVEAALSAGKDQAVTPVLEALAPTRPYKKDDLDSYVVHDLQLIGASALPPLRTELKSKSWVARAVAVRAIGRLGTAADGSALQPLVADGAKLVGFGENATVGSEAKAAMAVLKSK
jgi:hypothetical protein